LAITILAVFQLTEVVAVVAAWISKSSREDEHGEESECLGVHDAEHGPKVTILWHANIYINFFSTSVHASLKMTPKIAQRFRLAWRTQSPIRFTPTRKHHPNNH
jgi:hypothetical protein